MKANKQEFITKALVLSFGKTGMTLSIPEFDLLDRKVTFNEIEQFKDAQLEQDGVKKKLCLKISNKTKNQLQNKKEKYYNDEEDDGVFFKKIEFEIFQEIEIKLGVNDKFPIDYKIWLTFRNEKNELEYII